MGAVTAELERVAREAGVTIRTNSEVEASRRIPTVSRSPATDSRSTPSGCSAASPRTSSRGCSATTLPPKPSGSQFKINLLVSRLPALKSGIDPAIAFAGTFHLGESMTELEAAWATAAAGKLPGRSGG